MPKRKPKQPDRGPAVYVRLPVWQHEEVKKRAASLRRTLADYVRGLILRDLEEEKQP